MRIDPDDRPQAETPSLAEAGSGRDRGVSPIGSRFGAGRSRLMTLAALAAGCGAVLFATWERGDGRDAASGDETPPARQLTLFEPARRPEPPRLEGAADAAHGPSLFDDAPLGPAPDFAADVPEGTASAPSPADRRRVLAESARRAPLMAYSRGGAGGAPDPASRTSAASLSAPLSAPARESGAATGSLDGLRAARPIAVARAGRLPDRNVLVTAGTSLPCVLQTAMDSTTPGYVSCLISRDVWSDNGAVVLMERGTRVLGEYRGGLQQGRKRLFVLWTRAVTPQGVAVALASPAADALGRAGLDGVVDARFWDRFGAALLLTVVDDAVYAAAGQDRGLRGTSRLPSEAAAIALQGSIGVPPTLRLSQGSEVSIFVAQDLSFADVYGLRLR